jgi:hypothetical protein
MSRLFIGLYLDEDVNVLVATLLRARGFGATTAHAVGQLGKSDAEQLAHAVGRLMTLLTHTGPISRTSTAVLARRPGAPRDHHRRPSPAP